MDHAWCLVDKRIEGKKGSSFVNFLLYSYKFVLFSPSNRSFLTLFQVLAGCEGKRTKSDKKYYKRR